MKTMKHLPHNFAFDPTHGYTLEDYRAIEPPPGPPDFDDFWKATYTATKREANLLSMTERESASVEHRLFELHYRTLQGVSAGAWFVQPKDRPVRMAVVMGHGYGADVVPAYPRRDAAFLFTCAPGFGISAQEGLPGVVFDHVVHGLESRETYILRYCAANLWSAAWILKDLLPAARDLLVYMGGSFGGGVGALALPWEPLFKRGHLMVPTFGHQELRLTLRCEGSGHAVQQYIAKHPEAVNVLRYFDAASAALRIKIPVMCAPATFDPAVPPAGQMAVANALRKTGHIVEISAGHFEHPELAAEMASFDQLTEKFFWAEAPLWDK